MADPVFKGVERFRTTGTASHKTDGDWASEPDVDRLVDGIPGRWTELNASATHSSSRSRKCLPE